MTVAAVLLSVAIPSYSYLINASRLTSTANDFVAAVNQARLGAIKRNGSTQFCSNVNASNGSDTLGSQCSSQAGAVVGQLIDADGNTIRSEEHTSELQSLMRISYAVFCLKKNKNINTKQTKYT